MKMFKNKKFWLAITMLMVLAGCTNIIDPETRRIFPEKIIYLSTTFSEMFANDSWFATLIVYPISQGINFLSQYMNVVWAIVIMASLIKLLTLGMTIKSTVASQKMQLIQPELQKIQGKYAGKDDQASKLKMSQEMQALYSKHNINPLGSIVVMFIQLPVIIAMYTAVQRSSAVIEGALGGHSLQLSPSDAIGQRIWIFVAIFVFMIIVQFISMKLPQWFAKRSSKVKEKKYAETKPAGPNMDIMMYTSVVMIGFLGFTWPTGMSVYWATSSVLQILQTIFIQVRYLEPKKDEGF